MKEFKLPELGENIESASIIKVLVEAGDTVEEDQPVLEIETDKATIEVPSTVSGTIKELKVGEDDEVKVGQVVFTLEDGGEDSGEDDEEEAKEEKAEEEKDSGGDEKEKKKKSEPSESEDEETGDEEEQESEEEDDDDTGGSEEKEFILPELGENIDSAEVVSVLVSKGDTVEAEQPVLEIETDKATIEVPVSFGGKVTEVMIKEGEKAEVGQAVMKIETSGGGKKKSKPAKQVKKASKETKEKPEEKKTEQAEKKEKSEQKSESKEDTQTKDSSARPGSAAAQQPPISDKPAPAAPSVRRIAREIGVDINQVEGTGPGGRISMDDVKAHSKQLHDDRRAQSPSGGVTGVGIQQMPLPDFSVYGDVETKPMTNIRKTTAERLSYAWATIPHVTQFDKADVTELEKMRKTFSEEIKKQGGRLTLTAILVKVMTSALKVFPQFNASIDMQSKKVIYKDYYNIGIAVDTERGLVVPVLKDADKKNLTQISLELTEMAEKARDRKLKPDDMQGGCISISNLGGIGGTYFSPIINPPEVAILGVSRASMEPVYIDGEFKPRLMAPLSLSYDHRIIDGADGIRFLRWVVEALEQPLKLLIDG